MTLTGLCQLELTKNLGPLCIAIGMLIIICSLGKALEWPLGVAMRNILVLRNILVSLTNTSLLHVVLIAYDCNILETAA